MPLLLKEYYGLRWYSTADFEEDEENQKKHRVIELVVAHVLGGTLAMPSGELYANTGHGGHANLEWMSP